MSDRQTGGIGFDPLVWMRDGTPPSGADAGHEPRAPRKNKTADQPLRLPGSLTIQGIQDLAGGLRAALDGGGIVLDGAAVERIDGPSLQLLAACARDAQQRALGFRWLAASEVLRENARLLGLTEVLKLA